MTQDDFIVLDGEFDLDALLLELEDFEITINYSDGTSTTVGIGDCTISGFDPDVEGEQEITVSFGGKSVSFAVYVYSADNFVAMEGVSLNKTAVTIEAGGSETLAAVFDPEDATEKRVRWESDNPALAAVNAYGVINVPEDAEEGTVNITVTTIDGGITATCVVTVTTDGEPVQNLENLTVGLTAGDGMVTLAPQTAAAGFAFYYNKSDASVTAPAYGDAITTITGAAAYSAATDIAGPNGTAIYVQVYKVEITGNTIVGFGQVYRAPTETPDTAAPVPGNSGSITTADITHNSLTLNWAKATDDITAPVSLLYFVYQKDSAFTMSAGLPTDGNLLNAGGTADIATYNVSSLSAGTTYFFIVVVEDEAGNRAAYTAKSETTTAAPDTAPPVPGNSGTITTTDVTQNSLTLSWTKASDDESTQANLRYFVYQKTSAFTMVSGLPTDGTLLNTSGTLDIATYNVSGLSAGTTYYFIVVVEDEAGNRAAYTAKSETTAAVLENLTVGLTAGDGMVTLAPQAAATGFAFYYNKSAASVAAPAYGAAITTITGATSYSAATDIAGANGTAIYVQVYKVETTGNTITGFGQANRTPEAAPDTTAPVPGSGGTISTASVTQNSLTLDWTKASDDESAQADLRYFVYRKTSAFTMSGGLPTDGTLLNTSGTLDIATYNVSGLSAGTTYYFIVVVEDEAGNRAAYTAKNETTTAAPTYTISASTLTSFGSLPTPYTQPTAQTVTVTNTGTGTVTLNPPTATNYDIGALSETTIAAGEDATFTVRPKADLAVGNHNETINITGSNDAETSVDAAFTVLPAMSITVGPQSGSIIAGNAGQSATFSVTTVSIPGGFTGVFNWYTDTTGSTATTAPAGITPTGSSGTATITMSGNNTTVAGVYYFTVTFGTTESNVQSLTIAGKTVSVDAQNGTMNAGQAGQTVTFNVTTTYIASGTYNFPPSSVANLPTGVNVQGNVVINSSGNGTLTLAGDGSQSAGETSTLTLTIDGTTSATFTLTVASALAKNVTVGPQSGTLVFGTAGSATFPVTASNIANGQAGTVSWFDDAGGTTAGSVPAGINDAVSNTVSGAATVTMTATAAVVGGEYYFKVTIDGTTSTVATLTVNIFVGDGTSSSPYGIGNAAQLAKLAEYVNADTANYRWEQYILTGNIDLNVAPYNAGTGWTPIAGNGFRGIFDGDGKTISGLYINDSTLSNAGLFGDLSMNGVVKNLNLASVNITAYDNTGAVAGFLSDGSISNCTVSGSVDGNNRVGGIAGSFSGGSITNCYSAAAVNGDSWVGGVAGYINSTSSISNSCATGAVTGSQRAGGVAGYVDGGSINNCYSTGAVHSNNYAGGVAGYISGGSLSNCYATGAVSLSGVNGAGGIAGVAYSYATIENCAALNPSVKNENAAPGRIVGEFSLSTLSDNLAWAGMGTDGGTAFPAGDGLTHVNGFGINTTIATTEATYSGSSTNQLGWNFGSSDSDPWVWSGGSYLLPTLYWQSGTPVLPEHLE